MAGNRPPIGPMIAEFGLKAGFQNSRRIKVMALRKICSPCPSSGNVSRVQRGWLVACR
ncbi:MAG: hypothetical protein A4E70_02260 [Syntrophus sp. PtaU1.Bin005]|nr:MAG: hypothetical protein A4E70_02260 [Syntrophus sp. PtaU1.Bin005]